MAVAGMESTASDESHLLAIGSGPFHLIELFDRNEDCSGPQDPTRLTQSCTVRCHSPMNGPARNPLTG